MAILDQFGRPMVPAAPLRAPRPNMLNRVGYQSTSYDAASWDSEETRDWNAWLASPDIENNFSRDTIVARIRDLVRNDGWANGAVTRILDSAVGADFRLVSRPDWRYLSTIAPECDEVWANEFGRAAEALWRTWAYDPGRWSDGGRRYTIPQLFRLLFRSKLIDGEALAVLLWAPERIGLGKANWATALQVIDPDRLSNPHLAIDTVHRRAGVQIDDLGAAIGYHIRRAHMGDWFNPAASVTWDFIPRETDFGRPIVVHDFDSDRPGEHRPAGGVLKPIVARMRMLNRYDGIELQTAIVNSIFSAYIESPFDQQQIQDALGAGDEAELSEYQSQRAKFHGERSLKMQGARIPTLFPGEKIVGVDSKRPNSNFEAFQGASLRNFAAVLGTSYEQISQDWSKSNYSSARGALVEAWKTMSRRRTDFAAGVASPIYSAFLEEAMDRGLLPLPVAAPDFIDARGSYAACMWMGPPRGWIDPVKEAQGSVLRMDAGLSTLQQECAEQGLDYEEVIAQRRIEVRAFKEAGLNPPVWYGDAPAAETETKPEPR